MANLALPVASGSAGLGRFAINALGAGVGFTVAANYVLASVPASVRNIEFFGGVGMQEVILGASALVGAMAANAVYNKIAG